MEINELKLKMLIREAVREEMEEFYGKLALLLEQKERKTLTDAEKELIELVLEKRETSAEELAELKGVSREAVVQACQKLWKDGHIGKVRKGKKVYYGAPIAEE